ncbi:MAG: type II toxin-antitoxin system RelE/ParE family toxin [Rubrivivax sp.]
MSARLVFRPLAAAEIAEAYAWYDQPGINKADDFMAELERVERFIRLNPALYPRVEGEIHRANLRRYPYSLFYVVDGRTVSVLSFFHQRRDPKTAPSSAS